MGYRYVKLKVSKRRGSNNYVQLADIRFIDSEDNLFIYPSSTTVTTSINPVSSEQSGMNLIDNNPEANFCASWDGTTPFTIVIDLGEGESFDFSTYTRWQWYTCADELNRDPVSFTLYVSEDGVDYEKVDSATNANITTQRLSLAYTGDIVFFVPIDYRNIKYAMNTVEGMEHLVDNVPHDDDTMTFEGVNWFKFNDVVAENIYVSGNSWIGIGTSAEQLKVCRRDAKMYHFYRQEGTILGEYKFLKLRWEGYTYYQSTSNEYKLVYEVFLISDNRIFLNIIQSPINSSYLGASALVCGNDTTSFTVGTTAPYYFTFTPTNSESGVGWSVENEIIVIDEPFACKYLLSDNDNKIYTVENDALVELSETSFSKQLFVDYGIDNIPSNSLILSLRNPKLHYWQDSSYSLPTIRVSAIRVPKPQIIITGNIYLTHSSIVGIENVTIDSDDNSLFAMSFDDGSTWWNYVNNAWSQLSEAMSGQTKDAIESIGTNAWEQKITAKGHIKFRIILLDDEGYIDNITAHYLN